MRRITPPSPKFPPHKKPAQSVLSPYLFDHSSSLEETVSVKMLSSVIACVLLVGAIASKPGIPIGATRSVQEPPSEPHEPCCAPRYFTFNQVVTVTQVVDDSLSVELVNAEGAYDSLGERVSVKIVEDFFNGTELYFKSIEDYKEEVSYLIFKDKEGETCFKDKTEGQFPEECIPEDAKFIGEATLGDHDLVVDNFYYSVEEETPGEIEHVARSVEHEGCVPVGLLSRVFDSETEKEIRVADARLFNFNLGICDPDKYFKPPESCDEGRVLAKPTPKMLKMRRKNLFY